jgi:protein-L-isoaspartate(D-aspartate) O-methyltransferase
MIRGDTYRHQGLRKKLVETVRGKGISDEGVLEALNRVPRHLFFFDSAFLTKAYEDHAFPIGAGQTISQPYTVAYQSSLLEVEERMKVLEIGTGSGYQAAVLHEMGAKVFSIERQKSLYTQTKALLSELGYVRVKCFYGDGFEGLPSYAPFDRIIITAAAPEVPQKLLKQLKVGGKFVLPLEKGGYQTMLRITKIAEGEYETEEFEKFAFVPFLRGKIE